MIIALMDRRYVTADTVEEIMKEAIDKDIFNDEPDFIEAVKAGDIVFYVTNEPLKVTVMTQKTHFLIE